MSTNEKLKADIRAFCERHKIKPTKFGILAVNDPALVLKIERGRVPTLDMFDRINAFMGAYNDAS